MDADADQESRGQHDEGQMAIPADVAAHFILVKSKLFAGLQVLFDAPACPNGLHDGGQGCRQWGKDQVIGQFVRLVQTATKDQEVSVVHSASVDHTLSMAVSSM